MKTKKWKCLVTRDHFTAGKIYEELENGRIRDDDGDRRLKPQQYNNYWPDVMFKEIVKPIQLENK